MIRFRGAAVRRGERRALHPLDLAITERRVGVVGANGSGKSTFSRLLNGLLVPSEGVVEVLGLDSAREGKALRRRVGFLFQNPDNQIVYPTVGEDVAFGLKARGLGRAEAEARVGAALGRYGLAGFEDRLVHELSGGERQMVALAGVMALDPELLVLDEPTTLLDLRNKGRVMRAVTEADCAVVMVTHDLDLLDGFERVLVFDEGRLVADGPPHEAIGRYRSLAA